jgi:large subunit ribosomal protein L28
MTRKCDLTGKFTLSGHKVSHSQIKTNRQFRVNLQNVSLYSQTLNAFVSLRVAANTIRTVDKHGGLDTYLLTTRSGQLTEDAKRIKRRIQRAGIAKKSAKETA